MGRLAYAGGAAPALQGTTLDITASPTWPVQTGSTRKLIVLPLSHPDEFLALGMTNAPNDPKDRFVFAARGRVSDQLGDFTLRMEQAGALVENHDSPPLPYLQDYINQNSHVFTLRSLSPNTGENTVSTSMQEAAQPS